MIQAMKRMITLVKNKRQYFYHLFTDEYRLIHDLFQFYKHVKKATDVTYQFDISE